MLELFNIDINLLLCGDVNLPLQTKKKEYLLLYTNLLTNHVDSLSWYFIIVFNFIIFYNLHGILLYIRRGTSKLTKLVSDPFE